MSHTNVDVSGFDMVTRELARAVKRPVKEVAFNEMSSYIDKCLERTRAASVAKLKKSVYGRQYITAPESAYSPVTQPRRIKGQKKRPPGMLYYNLNNRYPAELWATIQRLQKESLDRKKKARGLSKKSWVQVADKLKMTLSKVPAYVAEANFRGMDSPQDNDGSIRETLTSFHVIASVGRLYDPRVGPMMVRTFRGREQFFKKNMATGVFNSLEEVARKYPRLLRAA